ncbi:MAG: hypothetical protein PVS3B3_16100 [Ktedonobacteraceae bacterium]
MVRVTDVDVQAHNFFYFPQKEVYKKEWVFVKRKYDYFSLIVESPTEI